MNRIGKFAGLGIGAGTGSFDAGGARPSASARAVHRLAAQLSAMALVLAPFGLAACGSTAAELCEAICDCRGCSNVERDECVIAKNGASDVADAYDCGSEHADLVDCELERGTCDNDNFTTKDACKAEKDHYGDCVEFASALE